MVRPITRGFFCFLPDFLADVLDEDAFRFTAHFAMHMEYSKHMDLNEDMSPMCSEK